MTENKFEDMWEKTFGKLPETGYVFNGIQVSLGWRALCINWSAQGIGFGEVALYIENQKIKIDDEYSGKDFCDALIDAAVKKLKAEEEEEIKKPEYQEEIKKFGFVRGSKIINSDFLRTMYDNVTWENNT